MGACRISKEFKKIKCDQPACYFDDEGYCILHSRNPEKNQEGDFDRAVEQKLVMEDYDFRSVFFPGFIYFGREFKQDADFSDAIFCGLANFYQASFKGRAIFFKSRFMAPANFFGGSFSKDVNFAQAIFFGDAGFSKVTFTSNAIFTEANFKNEVDFSQAAITGNLDCSGATFSNEANFAQSIFLSEAYFAKATFTKRANFFESNFKKLAIFSEVTFMEESDFSMAIFQDKSLFTEAIFNNNANFSSAIFKESLEFFGALIQGRILFMCLNLQEEGDQPTDFKGSFYKLKLRPKAVVCFQDLSLAHIEFAGTDLRKLEFHHVKWHPFPGGRNAIYDEVILRQRENKDAWFWNWFLKYGPYGDPPFPWPDEYAEVERLYRNLKINYEAQGDYKNAGDFHYGEMEMHRRVSKWRWCPFHWYNLYWALSGYGERPTRALVCLAAFLAIFTGLLAWAGLDLDPKHIPAFSDSFFYLLQKVTLQRPAWAEPVGFFGKLVAGFSVLLIPGQAALFLLALRNRLGRRR